MTHEINIYGDIVPFKWSNDGSEYDRSDLNTAIDSLILNEGDELIYNIHTYGGCTTTAFSMYNKLKRVKNEKKITLTSRADGYGASSGVILLLAADKRIGSKYLKPFVHNAWTWVMGDKKEVKKVYEELEKVDSEIADLYSEETSITKELAQQLMNESRDLTIEECLEYGFYTELENIHTVENSIIFNSLKTRNNEQRKIINNNMSDKNQKSAWNKLKKDMESFFGGAKNKIVFTADNSELDFYELADDETPAVGSKAKFDGKPAGESNDGEYTMPSGEVYKFTGEELTEIVPKVEENNELEVENQTLKDEVANLKMENKKLKDEKTALNKKVSDATTIINSFKDFDANFKDDDEEDEDKKRDPKSKVDPKETTVSSAIKNLKNKNTNGGNK